MNTRPPAPHFHAGRNKVPIAASRPARNAVASPGTLKPRRGAKTGSACPAALPLRDILRRVPLMPPKARPAARLDFAPVLGADGTRRPGAEHRPRDRGSPRALPRIQPSVAPASPNTQPSLGQPREPRVRGVPGGSVLGTHPIAEHLRPRRHPPLAPEGATRLQLAGYGDPLRAVHRAADVTPHHSPRSARSAPESSDRPRVCPCRSLLSEGSWDLSHSRVAAGPGVCPVS